MYPSYSPYNYCNNNPINYIDPSGTSILADFWGVMSSIGEAIADVFSSCSICGDAGCCSLHPGKGNSNSSGGGGQSMVNATEVGTYRSGMGNSPDPSTVQQSNSMPHEQQGGVKPNSSGGYIAPGNTNGTNASQTAGTPTPNGPNNGFIPLQSWAVQASPTVNNKINVLMSKVQFGGDVNGEDINRFWHAVIDDIGIDFFNRYG